MRTGDTYISFAGAVGKIVGAHESNCQGVLITLQLSDGSLVDYSLYTFDFLWRPTLLTRIKSLFRK
jgi:hypothetical protein